MIFARTDLDALVDRGLFETLPFINRLIKIARAFCCECQRIAALILYLAYYWVVDELLKTENEIRPEHRKWSLAQLSYFSMGTYIRPINQPNFADINSLACSIDRLRVYIDIFDGREKEPLRKSILNLTMQWKAGENEELKIPSEIATPSSTAISRVES